MIELKFDLQWGGYYVSKEETNKQYGVFRLLDFNQDAYQVALFREKFEEVPSMADLQSLTPFVGHAPIDSRALLNNKELYLIGRQELNKDDLDGYQFYLENLEVDEKYINELFERIIDFSKQAPIKLTLKIIDDELNIEERL